MLNPFTFFLSKKPKFNIPTRKQAHKIVKNSEAFYCSERIVDGYKVEMFNYRLAEYKDFKDNNAFEMRGLTFIYNPTSKEWERHFALTKFFNLDQNEDWMYDKLKDKHLKNVHEKLDGSMIQFVKLPNEKIVAKTKMAFESPEAQLAQKVYDYDINIQEFVKNSIFLNITLIWEVTSPHNQIVLNYDETHLTLLKARDKNGKYLDIEYLVKESLLRNDHIRTAKNLDYSLEELIELQSTREDEEGWVFQFEDGTLGKAKTEWYFNLHGLMTDHTRENILVKSILNEEIDDVLSRIQEGTEARDFMEAINDIVSRFFNHRVQEIKDKIKSVEHLPTKKEKSEALKEDPLFHMVMSSLSRPTDEAISERVRNHTIHVNRRLEMSRKWLIEVRAYLKEEGVK